MASPDRKTIFQGKKVSSGGSGRVAADEGFSQRKSSVFNSGRTLFAPTIYNIKNNA